MLFLKYRLVWQILQENLLLEEDMGEQFEVGNLKLTINSVETYEHNLIKLKWRS